MQKPNNEYLNRPYIIRVWDSFLEYPPCSIWKAYEILEEISLWTKELFKFLKDFVEEYGTHVLETPTSFTWLHKKTRKIESRVNFDTLDHIKLWETIQDTYFKGFFGKWWNEDPVPKWFVIYLLGRVWDPYELMKKWTLPQLNHYLDGFEYSENTKTEEWIKRNKDWANKQVDLKVVQEHDQELEDIADQYLRWDLVFKEE